MDLAFLQPLYERSGPWASVYADTSRHSESTAEERSLAASDVHRQLMEQGADQATAAAVREAMDDLRGSGEPHGRALFAAGGDVVLDPSLASAPPGTTGQWVQWSVLPHTAPLLDLAGEDPLCLVAVVDRRGAEFELRGARGAATAGSVSGRQWPMHRTSTADWSERHFQLRVENTWEHNAGEIAAAIARLYEDSGADLVVLVGDDRERRTVHDRLPQGAREAAVEALHGSGTRQLDEEIERLRAQFVHEEAAAELERFLAARAGDRGAAEGVPALVAAAREHRIDELLVRPEAGDPHRKVWVGEEPDQLAVRRTESGPLGEPRPEPCRADDALVRSAAVTGARALSVTSAGPGEEPAGGLGAVLRW
ncbi:Vms1/Ankzf1 family peptidyl-tRNA hydrolase [Streptomyces sp. NPDC050560]|uniref:baeRF2 domain-containing protein n=1 Tax=Streptomyces sp. NPDC050560 TaxID=3365630 RepID=UPI0037B1D326